MTVPSLLQIRLTKYLITLAVAFVLTACSSEENFDNTTSADSVIGITPSTTLSWIAPSERDDGTSISLSEIAGYRIYYGTTQGIYPHHIYINDGSVYQATLNNLESGTYYVVVTTIDIDGRESEYSEEVTKTI